MKRHYLTVTVLAFILRMTAHSPGNEETIATPTTTAAQAGTEKSTEAEDDMELKYFYGSMGEVTDEVVTVKDGAGREMKFDVSEAETKDTDTIGGGGEIEVAYASEPSSDATKVRSVDIITSATTKAAGKAAAEEDAAVTGTIERADSNTLTLTTDEGTYTLNTEIAQKISKDDVKSGIQANVTYYEDLEDDTDKPVAAKIVAEDTMGSEDARINTLPGKMAKIGADYVVIGTVDPGSTLFTFLGREGMFNRLKIGDIATIIYKSTLTDKTIMATDVRQKMCNWPRLQISDVRTAAFFI